MFVGGFTVLRFCCTFVDLEFVDKCEADGQNVSLSYQERKRNKFQGIGPVKLAPLQPLSIRNKADLAIKLVSTTSIHVN